MKQFASHAASARSLCPKLYKDQADRALALQILKLAALEDSNVTQKNGPEIDLLGTLFIFAGTSPLAI